MLNATFQCFTGIGENAECRLWEHGCLCWRDFLNGAGDFLSHKKQQLVKSQIEEARIALASGMADWFLNRLKGAAQLRVLNDFAEDTLFLDIETTGLRHTDEVTAIATWKNGTPNCFVKGINLSDFLHEAMQTRLLVTYNGERFDLPLLRRCFNIDLALPHLDMRIPLQSLGYRGGLKKCEKQLNFQRSFAPESDGADAVQLWQQWRNKTDHQSLRRLILYNIEDAYSLAWLAGRLQPRSMPNFPMAKKAELPPRPVASEILPHFAL